MKMSRVFKNMETGEFVSEWDLFNGYIHNLTSDPTDFKDTSFEDYIMNSTLIEVEADETKLKTYRLTAKYTEEWYYQVDIKASSQDEAERIYFEEPAEYNMGGEELLSRNNGWHDILRIEEVKEG